MIRAEMHVIRGDDEDLNVGSLYMRHPPCPGELIWFTASDAERLRSLGLPSSYRVETVAHWVTTAWTPNTHSGDPIHTLYVALLAVKECA